MAIDAMKILGSLLSSGAMSRGSGGDILGSLLGAVMGGGQSSGGGGLGDMLGSARGRSMQGGGGGGLGDLLGGLLGGASSGGGASGGGLGDLLGMAMKQFGGADAPSTTQFDRLEPQQANEQALILVRAMINAAKSDGEVDSEEQRKIIAKLGDVSQDEIDFVQRELAAPLDVDAFVRDIPNGMGEQVYTVSLMAIDLDSNPEAQYLHQLAQGLGIEPRTVNMIHEQLGAPQLYS